MAVPSTEALKSLADLSDSSSELSSQEIKQMLKNAIIDSFSKFSMVLYFVLCVLRVSFEYKDGVFIVKYLVAGILLVWFKVVPK